MRQGISSSASRNTSRITSYNVCYTKLLRKLPAYEELRTKLGLSDQQVAYVGDDVVDLPIMRRVGLAIAVNDAHPLVIQHAHWQTPHAGA